MARRGSGVVVGFALLAGAVALLAWNEGRAVRTARALDEGARRVVEVDADRAVAAADGTLIHLVGEVAVTAPLRDAVTGVSREALRLRRTVETLQWRRVSVGDDHDSRYDYRMEWSATRIDSDAFPEAFRNPVALPLASAALSSADARLADFSLTTAVVEAFAEFEPVVLGAADVEAIAGTLGVTGVVLDGTVSTSGGGSVAYLSFAGGSPEAPRVGDARVRFDAVPTGTGSVVASKVGGRLEPYPTRSGVSIAFAHLGVHGAAALFGEAVSQNRVLTNALRGFGALLLVAAYRLTLGPLAAVAGLIPLLGGVARFGVMLVALAFAGVTALVTIAVAWLAFRPIVAAGLLALAVAGVVALIRRPRSVAAPVSPRPPVSSRP